MTTLIVLILKLLAQLFSEFFSWQARKREIDKQYKLEMKDFHEMVTKSVNSMLETAKKESAQARNVEDEIDREINRPDNK